MKLSHATVALSLIKGSVSIHGAVELVEIPNNKPVPVNTLGSLGSAGS